MKTPDPVTADVSFSDAGPFEKMVSFEISSVDLKRAMNEASRRISREVSIAGFRRGKAPRRLVENQVGIQRIRADALDDLVPTRVGEILSQTEIVPVVPPLLESVTDADQGGVSVNVRITTWPRLESLPHYRGRQIQIPDVPSVSDQVDARLKELRHMYAPLQTVDKAVENGDFVIIDLTVMEGERSIDALTIDGFSYEVGSEQLIAQIDESLVGKTAGDEISVAAPLPEWLSATRQTSNEDHHDDQPAEGRYEIRIVEVQSRSIPELDDDWASEYTGHDSLEELLQEMGDEVEERHSAALWEMLAAETMKEITSELELGLPERLQNAQMELLFRNHLASLENAKLDYETYLERTGLDHQQVVEGLRRQAVAGLKARILIEGVIEAEGLVVDDAEVSNALREAAGEAEDPEGFLRHVEESVHTEEVRGDMLRARARAFMAMQVQPVDATGRPVEIEAPSWARDWFDSVPGPAESTDTRGDLGEALYEAEVINDPFLD